MELNKLKFTLKLFASFREAFGNSSVEYEMSEGSTAGDLVEEVLETFPSLERFRGHVVVTINKQSVSPEIQIEEGDEVSILPPVSGG